MAMMPQASTRPRLLAPESTNVPPLARVPEGFVNGVRSLMTNRSGPADQSDPTAITRPPFESGTGAVQPPAAGVQSNENRSRRGRLLDLGNIERPAQRSPSPLLNAVPGASANAPRANSIALNSPNPQATLDSAAQDGVRPGEGGFGGAPLNRIGAAPGQQAQPQQSGASAAETHWPEDMKDRKIRYFPKEENAEADEIFYRKHPELKRQRLRLGSVEAREWRQIRNDVAQNRYNEFIIKGVEEFEKNKLQGIKPGLDPKVLKALMIQESSFDPRAKSPTGPKGPGQMNQQAAKVLGLKVGHGVDEREDPAKAIPAIGKFLAIKNNYLEEHAYNQYGRPEGDEYARFYLAAYNGGEEVVVIAIRRAYDQGLKKAEANGLKGDEATRFAQGYATKWDNIYQKGSMKSSPLYAALLEYKMKHKDYPAPAKKYSEMGNYPVDIMARARL